ncbi:hypothetical protein DEA06_13690 [Microbacterium sp. Gd 4-13]|uniref:hypothetical protein n=1 Tax=Microbacterium sp. Gd 4-13 TaxID=2173179 RepID=UPI000D563689|nr:hypothetical protein [Microbacterium sp. Gd 4-13]PVW03253.1 hypothetical protein DEA06_13690 [Microbacterium sp. Gd 4-13]
MARRRRLDPVPAKWIAGTLVALLIVATIVLVVLALRSVQPTTATDATTTDQDYSFEVDPTTSASPTAAAPSPSPSSSASAAYPAAEARFFAVGSEGWWRATAGDCGTTAPLVEHSADGGRTWQDVTPAYRGIGQVASLDVFAGSEAEMVAAMGATCEVQALRTFTQGEFWQPYPEVLAASRYLDLADRAVVVLPGDDVAAPCAEPRSFRAAGDVVAVECAGTVSVLGSDRAWQALGATDAVALSIDGGTVVTASPADDCAGVAVTRWSGAGFDTATPLGCAPAADPAGPLALAVSGGRALVWSGDAVVAAE